MAHAQTVETILHDFAPVHALSGSHPGGLVSDSAGNLYGTADGGTQYAGVVFKLDPNGNHTVLYNFTGGSDGRGPNPGIVRDSAGNIFGTTSTGGATGTGVVYRLDPNGNETVLYAFKTIPDGTTPYGGLVSDAAGNLYGTTSGGGASLAGTIFKISPSGQETVLYNFTRGADGGDPEDTLLLDNTGTLYGTTREGGLNNGGVVFKFDKTGHETVLYTFQSGTDGYQPNNVVMDSANNLYGTANGGAANSGIVFRLDQAGHFTLLYSFAGAADGSYPGPVTLDAAGSLYGTTYYGGTANVGLVYKLDAAGNKTTLHSFAGSIDGAGPDSNLILDAASNVYGTTAAGGIGNIGLIYKLDPTGHTTVQFSFPYESDGANTYGGLALDPNGNVYGTTVAGGPSNHGTIYKIDPAGNETVLYAFQGAPDDAAPGAGVTLDANGTLYGTTAQGGTANAGTVYKFDTAGHESVLYSFQDGADGGYPQTGVTLDSAGNLYGTTQSGNAVLYKLDLAGHQTVLYTFPGYPGLDLPMSAPTLDGVGNLYGTTWAGSAANQGAVYRLDLSGQMTVLYAFSGKADGGMPYAGVTLDAAGNLYGTSDAVIYKIDTTGKFSVMYTPTDGYPSGGVILDPAGNLYGTIGGNAFSGIGGAVFQLDPSGAWTELDTFGFWDGPSFGVVRDSSGNLYGTSTAGGANNTGMVYKLSFPAYSICGQVTVAGSGIAGVTMTLSGGAGASVTTDSSGNYCLSGPAGGNYVVAPSSAGMIFTPVSLSFTNLMLNQTANFSATCAVTVTPAAVYVDAASQIAPPLAVTSPTSCPWTAASGSDFISITSGTAGTGSGTVTFLVAANATGAPRTGVLTAGNQVVVVNQRETSAVFNDVTAPDYFFDFADWMYADGITSGCSANPLLYCPETITNREQMAVLLIAAIERGNSFTYTQTPYFTDVPANSPYFKFIQKLKDLGITGGCAPTLYCPDNPVTRAEMAVFIIVSRYGPVPFTYPTLPYFTDVPPSSPFFPFVQKMAQSGITGGCAPGLYCPDVSLNRGQMSVFVVTGLLNQLLPFGTPVVSSAMPDAASPGQAVRVTLNAANTHFVQGVTQVTAATGIMASNVTVLSDSSLTVDLALDAGIALNPTSIVVTTGSEEAVLPNGFLVN